MSTTPHTPVFTSSRAHRTASSVPERIRLLMLAAWISLLPAWAADENEGLTLGQDYTAQLGQHYSEVTNRRAWPAAPQAPAAYTSRPQSGVMGGVQRTEAAGSANTPKAGKESVSANDIVRRGVWQIGATSQTRPAGASSLGERGQMVVLNRDTNRLAVVEGLAIQTPDEATARQIAQQTAMILNIYSRDARGQVWATLSGAGNAFDILARLQAQYGAHLIAGRVLLLENEKIPM